MARNPDRETVFRFKQFEVRNSLSAMKVGTDGVLLGAWFDLPHGATVLDVGTGCGVIGLMAAQRGASCVVEVEIDADAANEATMNAAASPWTEKVHVVHADFTDYDPGVKFDRIVSNPPFFTETTLSPDAARAMARHEGSLSVKSLMARAATMLADDGRIAVVAPMSRAADVEYAAALVRLFPVRVCRVVTSRNPMKPPSRIMMEFGLRLSSIELDEIHTQSEEYLTLMSPFYLDRK